MDSLAGRHRGSPKKKAQNTQGISGLLFLKKTVNFLYSTEIGLVYMPRMANHPLQS